MPKVSLKDAAQREFALLDQERLLLLQEGWENPAKLLDIDMVQWLLGIS